MRFATVFTALTPRPLFAFCCVTNTDGSLYAADRARLLFLVSCSTRRSRIVVRFGIAFPTWVSPNVIAANSCCVNHLLIIEGGRMLHENSTTWSLISRSVLLAASHTSLSVSTKSTVLRSPWYKYASFRARSLRALSLSTASRLVARVVGCPCPRDGYVSLISYACFCSASRVT